MTDVIPIRSVAGAVIKGIAWKFGGSHTWGATKAWLIRRGYGEFPGQVFHHWFFHQNEGIGWHMPEVIKNQVWNLKRLPHWPGMRPIDVSNAIHGRSNFLKLYFYERWWYGTPDWFKAVIFSGSGKAVNAMRDPDECEQP